MSLVTVKRVRGFVGWTARHVKMWEGTITSRNGFSWITQSRKQGVAKNYFYHYFWCSVRVEVSYQYYATLPYPSTRHARPSVGCVLILWRTFRFLGLQVQLIGFLFSYRSSVSAFVRKLQKPEVMLSSVKINVHSTFCLSLLIYIYTSNLIVIFRGALLDMVWGPPVRCGGPYSEWCGARYIVRCGAASLVQNY